MLGSARCNIYLYLLWSIFKISDTNCSQTFQFIEKTVSLRWTIPAKKSVLFYVYVFDDEQEALQYHKLGTDNIPGSQHAVCLPLPLSGFSFGLFTKTKSQHWNNLKI